MLVLKNWVGEREPQMSTPWSLQMKYVYSAPILRGLFKLWIDLLKLIDLSLTCCDTVGIKRRCPVCVPQWASKLNLFTCVYLGVSECCLVQQWTNESINDWFMSSCSTTDAYIDLEILISNQHQDEHRRFHRNLVFLNMNTYHRWETMSTIKLICMVILSLSCPVDNGETSSTNSSEMIRLYSSSSIIQQDDDLDTSSNHFRN
jgi:hypothetical protein